MAYRILVVNSSDPALQAFVSFITYEVSVGDIITLDPTDIDAKKATVMGVLIGKDSAGLTDVNITLKTLGEL